MAPKVTTLTAVGHKKLLSELRELKADRRKDVTDRIRKATETEGTVDNAEYDEAKNEQGFLEGRIADLENVLANAVVASKVKVDANLVQLGSSVTVETDKGKKTKYIVVGSVEAAPLEGKISVESPIGSAILDHRKGDVVKVRTPSGDVQVKIAEVG